MRRTLFALMLVAAVSMPLALSASGQMMGGGTSNNNPMVGGAPMYRTKNIVENAMNSADHTTLVARMNGMNGVSLTDEKGGTSNVTTADVYQSNGVIHVIDTVVMPR